MLIAPLISRASTLFVVVQRSDLVYLLCMPPHTPGVVLSLGARLMVMYCVVLGAGSQLLEMRKSQHRRRDYEYALSVVSGPEIEDMHTSMKHKLGQRSNTGTSPTMPHYDIEQADSPFMRRGRAERALSGLI